MTDFNFNFSIICILYMYYIHWKLIFQLNQDHDNTSLYDAP